MQNSSAYSDIDGISNQPQFKDGVWNKLQSGGVSIQLQFGTQICGISDQLQMVFQFNFN